MFISEVTLGLWLERELIYHLSLNKPGGKKKPEEKKKKRAEFLDAVCKFYHPNPCVLNWVGRGEGPGWDTRLQLRAWAEPEAGLPGRSGRTAAFPGCPGLAQKNCHEGRGPGDSVLRRDEVTKGTGQPARGS